MPQLSVYRLAFSGGLHLGTRGVNLEESAVTVPSDTLFAALVDAYRRDGGEADAFTEPFPRNDSDGDPPFLLTSAFPFTGQVHFFPMPVPLQGAFKEETLKKRRKDVQRIRFVSEALFRDILDRKPMDDRLFLEDPRVEPTDGVALQGGVFWLTTAEIEALPTTMQRPAGKRHALRNLKVYAQAQVPRVTVDRIGAASTIFHAGRVSFAPGCGLWFGVDWRAPDTLIRSGPHTYRAALGRALALLADDGLGGERTAGYGRFVPRSDGAIALPDALPGRLVLLLSRYHPRTVETRALSSEGAAYALTAVGGWLRTWDGAAQRRKRLWLVAEGSLIRPAGNGPWGDIIDVRPTYKNTAGDIPHPVWRYGLALGAGVQEATHG